MDMITYETIRKIHREEKQNHELQELPENFFFLVKNWIEQKQKMFNETKNMVSLLELENAKKLLDDLINRRERKIVIAALHTIRGEAPPNNLTDEEAKFFDRIVMLLKEFKNSLKEQFIEYDEIVKEKIEKTKKEINELKEMGKSENPSEEKNINITEKIKVKVLKDIPKFVDSDLKSYGPLKTGEEAELPKEIANILITRNMAERI